MADGNPIMTSSDAPAALAAAKPWADPSSIGHERLRHLLQPGLISDPASMTITGSNTATYDRHMSFLSSLSVRLPSSRSDPSGRWFNEGLTLRRTLGMRIKAPGQLSLSSSRAAVAVQRAVAAVHGATIAVQPAATETRLAAAPDRLVFETDRTSVTNLALDGSKAAGPDKMLPTADGQGSSAAELGSKLKISSAPGAGVATTLEATGEQPMPANPVAAESLPDFTAAGAVVTAQRTPAPASLDPVSRRSTRARGTFSTTHMALNSHESHGFDAVRLTVSDVGLDGVRLTASDAPVLALGASPEGEGASPAALPPLSRTNTAFQIGALPVSFINRKDEDPSVASGSFAAQSRLSSASSSSDLPDRDGGVAPGDQALERSFTGPEPRPDDAQVLSAGHSGDASASITLARFPAPETLSLAPIEQPSSRNGLARSDPTAVQPAATPFSGRAAKIAEVVATGKATPLTRIARVGELGTRPAPPVSAMPRVSPASRLPQGPVAPSRNIHSRLLVRGSNEFTTSLGMSADAAAEALGTRAPVEVESATAAGTPSDSIGPSDVPVAPPVGTLTRASVGSRAVGLAAPDLPLAPLFRRPVAGSGSSTGIDGMAHEKVPTLQRAVPRSVAAAPQLTGVGVTNLWADEPTAQGVTTRTSSLSAHHDSGVEKHPAAGVDIDDIVDRALRAVMSRLAIEKERRGFSRWG